MGIAHLKRHKKVLILSFLACLGVVCIRYSKSTDVIVPFEDFISDVEESVNFLINTEGCAIPNLDAFDSSIKQFIFDEAPVVCNNGTPALVSSNLTSIYLVNSSFPFYNIKREQSLRCCYNAFWRTEPEGNSKDNNVKFGKDCVRFQHSASISDEFIRVKCYYETNKTYEDYFAFVPPVKYDKTLPKRNSLNVLVMGLDSISRLNLIRQMPMTIQALKDLGAVEFFGFNKVGDNTFPNLIPFLTGLNEEELKASCWAKTDDRFDDCPFVWKKFNAAGFRTAFAEDASWMGLFNYARNGFLKRPTDYYWGPFNYNALKSVGNAHRMNADQCMGSTEDYVRLLEYAERFVATMDKERENYFGFFWQSSLSHDFLNKPKLGDGNYSGFLQRLKENGHLNNTVLIFMSDHGIRWGGIRSTHQGSIEERLPFLYIFLPSWYQNRSPLAYSNLIRNARRLTTPFDLHYTLEDLLNPLNLNDRFLNTRSAKMDLSNRGQSLFNVVPSSRTCDSARIPAHFCTCKNSIEIDVTIPVVKKVVKFSVDHINDKLSNYSECAALNLLQVLNARVQTGSNEFSDQSSSSDFTVTFSTSPSKGIFEATVNEKRGNNETEYQLVGKISRLNLYGNQSICVEDFHLKLFCYCKQLILSGSP